MNEAFLRQVFSELKCSVCGQRYDVQNIDVLGQEEELWFISVVCSHCQTRGLVAAVVQEAEEDELVTDLTEAEDAKFAQVEAVGIDDVLDMCNLLKSFDGSLLDLFAKK
ncbi:hypothetical protein ACFLWV_03090 [Chloroflexota bacterium]